MLINDIRSERSVASMAKNSSFYIEVAKFVQAYRTIVSNPNVFLKEVDLPLIDEKNDILNWNQFVKIAQGCDLGFKTIPTETDLIVFYNYAIQIGSIDQTTKRIASVGEVADAQKHYYNFIDEVTDKAQTEYMKQHKITESREREAKLADNSLLRTRVAIIFCCIFMAIGVFACTFGIVSLFFDNVVVDFFGRILPIWKKQYIGGILLIILGILLFVLFDGLYIKQRRKYLRLKRATDFIFKRNDETYLTEIVLKRKYDSLKKDLQTVQNEMNDKNKTYDVMHNIDMLKSTNKYYQKLCKNEDELSSESSLESPKNQANTLTDEDFAPIKLSKEQEENLRSVSRETINLEGHFDDEAYNEKFEKSTRKKQQSKEQQRQEVEQEEVQSQQEDLAEIQKTQEVQQQTEVPQNAEPEINEQELMDSINYIRNILGFGPEQSDENEMDKQ